MKRPDYSSSLIHLVSASCSEEAENRLKSILMERRITASDHKIMGQYKCVCLTESPASSIARSEGSERYQPFGLVFEKPYVFGLGGRHVIYQEKPEFYCLPECMRWRHVTFSPNSQQKVDFTWEREWRIRGDLEISPQNCRLLLPDEAKANDFVQSLLTVENEQRQRDFDMYRMIFDDDLAVQLASDGVSIADWKKEYLKAL